MNTVVSNKENIQTIHLYTILIQGMSTIFTDQMPAYLVFRKVHSVIASTFSTVSHVAGEFLRMKRQNLM